MTIKEDPEQRLTNRLTIKVSMTRSQILIDKMTISGQTKDKTTHFVNSIVYLFR